jgi:hypothetical protein
MLSIRFFCAGSIAAVAMTAASLCFGQTPPPPSGPLPPLPPAGQGQPSGQPSSGYQQPPPAAPPPGGYPPAPPSYGQPPPQGYAQPGYGYYSEPPIPPPPPKRSELSWSIRFNLFDLLFGRLTGELEYAFAGPLSLTIAPQYIFADPRQAKDLGVTASGAGIYGELGLWVEGRPLRGYFLKAHAGHEWLTFHGYNQDVDMPATRLGLMFGSQSIYGGWFTLAAGIGVAVDTQSKESQITGRDNLTGTVGPVPISASGLFGNGWDLLSQIGIGGSF